MRSLLAVALVCATSCKKADGGVEKLVDEPSVTALAATNQGVAWVASRGDASELVYWSGGKSTVITKGFVFHIVLADSAIYWADGDHLWSASLDGKSRQQLAEISEIQALARDGDTIYYASKDKVGRIGTSGANDVVFTLPPDAKQTFEAIAVADSAIVAVTHGFAPGGKQLVSELWRIDTEPKSIDRAPGPTDLIAIDGPRIVWGLGIGEQVVELPLAGGARARVGTGLLVAVGAGTVFVAQRDQTLAIRNSGERRIGPRCTKAALAGKRLYCRFSKDETIGSVAIE